MSRGVRLLVVGLALAVAGAFFGAIAGTAVVLVVGTVIKTTAPMAGLGPFGLGAVVGAPFGAVLAPLAAFTFLRQAPLWRLFLDTTIGTILGALLGVVVMSSTPPSTGITPVFAGGILGFVLAAALLAWRTRRREPAPKPPVEA